MTSLHVSFGAQISRAAERHHLDPRLLAAVAAQETGGPGSDSGRNIVGDGGHGHGLFQIDDRWHPFAAGAAAMNPAANADYAAGMLRGLLDRYGGDVHAALSAYNAGSPHATGSTTDWGDGRALGYADSVLRHYARLAPEATARDTQVAALPDVRRNVDALRQWASAASPASVPTATARHAAPPAVSPTPLPTVSLDAAADGDDPT